MSSSTMNDRAVEVVRLASHKLALTAGKRPGTFVVTKAGKPVKSGFLWQGLTLDQPRKFIDQLDRSTK